MVGPVILETTDGVHFAQGTYTKHEYLRPFQIAYGGIWYVQNRQTPEGWVYRAIASTPGTMTNDPALEIA